MIESYTTRSVAESNRLDFWNALHADTFNGLVIDANTPCMVGEVRRWSLNNSTMIWPRSTPVTVQRRNGVGGPSSESRLVLHLLHEGKCSFSHRGRNDELQQGDMTLFASDEYYRLDINKHQMLVLEVDRRTIEERVPNLDELIARRLSGSVASTRLLHQFLLSFWREGGTNLDPMQASAYERVLCELLINSLNGRGETQQGEIEGLWNRARALIEARFRDPELTPAGVADELGVSQRWLQYAAARSGATVVRYISDRRLEAAKEALALGTDTSITRIAFDCGFSSSAYFARCFAERFGASPSACPRPTAGAATSGRSSR